MPAAEITWLVGVTGAGKSTVGRLLAERRGVPFIDLDERIEAEAGRSVSELFAGEGEAGFRAREAALLRRIAEDGASAVVATGGGACCTSEAWRLMRGNGKTVWLRADLDEVMARIDLTKRPLLAAAPDPRAKLVELATAREPWYRRALFAIDRKTGDSAAVAAAIVPFLALTVVRVELGERSYPVLIDDEAGAEARFAGLLLHRAPPERTTIGLVTDETVGRLHGDRYFAALHKIGWRVVRATVPAGENAKSLAEAERLAERLVAGGLDRRGVVVALGGGVVGDLAGFVASVLFRGVGFVNVPTTLLAQVDASVGGKTGVNLGAGKNLVGTFHQPLFVFADIGALATLPPRDRIAGLAEVVKHALLDDSDGDTLARLEAGTTPPLAELVASSCAFKARVVAADERERLDDDGGRVLLNLGHTIGHALETASLRAADPLRHGEAVALGLIAAVRVSRAVTGVDLVARLTALLSRLGLPVDLDRRLTPEVLELMSVDKKRAGATLRFIVLDRPGAARAASLTLARLVEILVARRSP